MVEEDPGVNQEDAPASRPVLTVAQRRLVDRVRVARMVSFGVLADE